MKKTLLTILGILGFSAFSFSQADVDSVNRENKRYILNKLSIERKFNLELHEDYSKRISVSDDEKYLVSDLDLDKDGKLDIKAYFKYLNLSNQNAWIVLTNENEDNIPDWVYLNLDNDSQGFLETKMTYQDYLKFTNYLRNKRLGRDIVMLKPLKSIIVTELIK